jgi:hypothetical protein
VATDKIQFINEVIDNDVEWEKRALISSLIFCLSPEEACSFLDLEFLQQFDIRALVLRKIGTDIEDSIQPCHNLLIDQLINACNRLPYNKKNSCAYCLDYLYDYLPAELQNIVLDYLISSKYVGLRRRAYKKLSQDWTEVYQSVVADVWDKYADLECALLIVKHFQLSFVQEHFQELEEIILKGPPWALPKLYLKVVPVESDKLKRLANLDEITYAYLCVKSNCPLTQEEALRIFEKNKADKRIGLLIWCFGRMGLWTVLANISKQGKEIEEERTAELLSRSRQSEKLGAL